jgi:hypothetical protein
MGPGVRRDDVFSSAANYVMVDVPIPTLKIWNQDIATS